MPLTGLYAITPDGLNATDLLSQVEAALKGGASMLQYRNKIATSQERREQAEALIPLSRRYGVPLIINDDFELALEIGADGVHVGEDDGEIGRYRREASSPFIIGASCYHRLTLAEEAILQGADYIAFGRFFPSHTKPGDRYASLETLKIAKSRFQKPVVAIGGITLENAPSVIEAGADAVAVIAGLFEADDIEKRAAAFSNLFRMPE